MRRRVCGVLLLALAWVVVGGTAPAGASDAGPWVRPVDGPVARWFEPPRTRYGAGHRGVDLSAAPGTPVLAAGAGRVSYAGLLAGRGVVVVVHGELRTTYEPLTASVRVGQLVTAGAVLGRLSTFGHCPAGCLHWGLLRAAVYLDPLQLLRRGPSRLLPVPPSAAAALLAADARPPSITRLPSRPPAAPLEVAAEPSWSLRAAELPWGVMAVMALLAGLILLRTRPPGPVPRRPEPPGPEPEPPQSAQASAGPPAARIERLARTGQLVDLGTERSRRRIA
jgi:hypothetical protein